MGQEEEFLQKLSDLRETARLQGQILSREQAEAFAQELSLGEDQKRLLYDYLKQNHIGIGEPLRDDELLSGEELSYLDHYLAELKELPAVSESQKRAVCMAAMAGEADAKKRLLEIMLPDVVEIAKLYAGQGVYLEDLIGEGNVALALGVEMLGALEEPDEVSGMLGKMIMDAMEEFIGLNADENKINQKVLSRVQKVADQAGELAKELRRKVTVQELAQESGLSEKEIRDAVRMSANGIGDIVSGAE